MHIDGCLTPNDLLKSSELVGGVWLEALYQDSSGDDSGGHWYRPLRITGLWGFGGTRRGVLPWVDED